MASINYATREINCKLVYYGPGMCGKTSNLQWIHGQVTQEKRGDMVSLATPGERTLYFDFLPVEMAEINDFKVKFACTPCRGKLITMLHANWCYAGRTAWCSSPIPSGT